MVPCFRRQGTAGNCIVDDRNGVCRINPTIDSIIHRKSRCLITAAEARDVTDRNLIRAAPSECLLKTRFQFRAAAQVAGHVGTDLYFHARWGGQVKVRIETGDGMNLADRDVVLERELLELIRRQSSHTAAGSP